MNAEEKKTLKKVIDKIDVITKNINHQIEVLEDIEKEARKNYQRTNDEAFYHIAERISRAIKR